jgi:hypothetical protein
MSTVKEFNKTSLIKQDEDNCGITKLWYFKGAERRSCDASLLDVGYVFESGAVQTCRWFFPWAEHFAERYYASEQALVNSLTFEI